MKKIITFLICIATCFSFVACNNDDSQAPKDSSSITSDSSSETKQEKEFNATEIMKEINTKFTFDTMTQFDDAMFLDVMYGIQSEDVKQFGMMINETGISADEIIIVEGVDDQAGDRIFENISNWYIAKGVQMKDYIPAEYEKIEKCQVHRKGNITYMIVLDNHEEVEKIVESYL